MLIIGVFNAPGSIVLTCKFHGNISRRRQSEKDFNAYFDAEYAHVYGKVNNPPAETTLTTRELRLLINKGKNFFVILTCPKKLTSINRRIVFMEVQSIQPCVIIPALFTNAWRLFVLVLIKSYALSIVSCFVISKWKTIALDESFSFNIVMLSGKSTPTNKLKPFWLSSIANAWPIPVSHPLMRTYLLFVSMHLDDEII